MKKQKPTGSTALTEASRLYKAGDYESAVATLGTATVDEEDYLDLAYLMGLCYARLRRFDEALLYLEQVVTQGDAGSRAAQCRMALAYVYAETGRSKLSEYELNKLVEDSRETPQVCSALGHANWKQGRLEDGLRWYSKALELDPDNPTALNGYGYLLACSGRDLQKAMTCCRKALDSDPGNPAYADSIGWAYFKLGMLDEAGRYLRSALDALGDDDESRGHIAALEKAMLQR